MAENLRIALIRGDGIGVDVSDAAVAVAVVDAAIAKMSLPLGYEEIASGAGYFVETGKDIEPGGEECAGEMERSFLAQSVFRQFVTATEPKSDPI